MTAPASGPLCTRDSLAADLRTLGVRPGETLLVHASLSSLGWVCGGAVTVVEALLDALGGSGTLTAPTHTGGNSDPAGWSNPPVPEEWWQPIRDSMPAYDPRVSRTDGMGVIPETLRCWPGALRSSHPQTSFAAMGPLASDLTGGHALDCRLGERSPLARLEEAGARVLLLGVGFACCTAFHLAEYRQPDPPQEESGCAAAGPHGRAWRTFTDTVIDSGDFAALGAAYSAAHPPVTARVGGADALLFDLTQAVAFAVPWLARHRRPPGAVRGGPK